MLAPGGLVPSAFQAGDEPPVLTEAFGQSVDLTFHRRQPVFIGSLLTRSGMCVYAQLLREPDGDGSESTSHAYLIARKR